MADELLRKAIRKYKSDTSFVNYLNLARKAFQLGTSAALILGPDAEQTLLETLRDFFDKHPSNSFAHRSFALELQTMSPDEDGDDDPFGLGPIANELYGVEAILNEINPQRNIYNNFTVSCRLVFPYSEIYMPNTLSDRFDFLSDEDNWDRCRSCLGKKVCQNINCGRGVVTPKRKKLAQTPHIIVSCRRLLPEDIEEEMGEDPSYTPGYAPGMTADVNNFVQAVCGELRSYYSEVRCPSQHDYCFVYRSTSYGH